MGENNNRKAKIVSDRLNTFFTNNKITFGSSIPTTGTYKTGDIIVNTSSTSEEEPMWICNEGGTPGRWGLVGNTSINIVKNYATMMEQKSSVGNLYYVRNDENWDDEPGFYIVLTVKENENGVKVPDEVDRINKKENNVPTLSYDSSMPEGTKMYLKENQDLILKFNFTSATYGDGKYRVYRDGVLMRSWSAAKGSVLVNLGPITTDGTFNITVTATDYLTIPAPETLSFKVIVGGLKLTSTFDETLMTAIYEEGDNIDFPFNATVSDLTATMKMHVKLHNGSSIIADEIITLDGANVNGTWTSPAIPTRGQYYVEAQAYTGESVDDTTEGTFVSSKLEYSFRVLRENEIAIMSELKTNQIDDNTYLSIPFKITSKIANYFIMRGEIFKLNGSSWETVKKTADVGITSTVNITNYWSVGKLSIGSYKFVLKAFTVDGGVESLEAEEKTFEVVESSYERVQPVKANLIAWFDANDKRNNDEEPDVWHNNSELGDTYRILLHDLNYSNNGWKHVDERLADNEDGEMMLKFTGDSYGELVKVGSNGELTRYNPFSIFTNSGQQGITIETAIKTRCVGERNSRVMTCMESTTNDTPGIGITFEQALLGSDSQINSLEFIEDEWVHIAFVIDNNIRNLSDVGQEMIEDLNQTKTMRIYLNGVLCSCSTYKSDKFLDAAGRSYPLILNACLDSTDNPVNFGECEIKFLRIYNSYLKSSEVLNNYISHIYDQAEQIAMSERNNTDIAVLPTVTFRRNLASNNKNTFGILNSITDKKMSKSTCVDCIMEYNDGNGNIVVYDNVDVYLQGTSSLQYPVKNYKIKSYADANRTSKFKFVPPGKEGEWVEDYTYTLKCDYMEQSHMNNTPTARFFDKIITHIGGESPARKEDYRDSIDGFPCIVYYNDGEDNVLVGSFMFNIDKAGAELGFECDLYDEDGNVIGNGKDSCVSYEGTANASDTAGCFFKLEESIENVYKYYLEDSYNEYLSNNGLTSDKFSFDSFKAGVTDRTITEYSTFEEFKLEYDETDYIMADFEARYSFNEDDDAATYKPMLDLVNWVSDSIKAGTFKKDFETHLDLNYMLAYFLQMQMFTQVDNCGKNCMWDTWDGVKFYPRPYDMDTSMGLSNTGTETIRVDAEILPELSPFEVEGTHAGYSYNDKTTDLRYLSFNTKTSKLWNAFAKEFEKEIKDTYKSLRNSGVFSFNSIYKNATSITYDMIGEIYYNKDAASKYLTQTTDDNSEYLKMLHGNRQQKFKKFLKERLIFLDTVYDYMESDIQADSLNSIITLRSDVLYGQSATETMKCYLGISSYSPQYVSIAVGSGQDAIITAYVGPESTYIDPDTGLECEGTLFSFPIRGTDKEMTISGAGNIKDLARIQLLNVRDLTITKAERIINLDLSYSSRMTALTLGKNKYLRTLNCSNSYLLGTGTNGQLLDLTQCVNLREIDISYTKINAVNFPPDNTIKSINLSGSSIKNIEINGAEFLNQINITGCENVNRFKLDRCTRITEVDVSGSTIKDFMVTNCPNVVSVNLSNCKSISNFDVTNSYNIETLNMTGNTSEIMADLHLYSMYNLRNLYVSQTTSAGIIRLPKYLNEVEAAKAANGEEALLWDTLNYLNLSSSSVTKIQYGSADTLNDYVDMSQLYNLTYLSFQYCTEVVEIRNLNFTGNLASLFYQCKKLRKITGELTNTTASVNSIFAICYELCDINELNLNFKGVTSATYAFERCFRGTTPMLKKILDACGSTLTDVTHLCHMAGMDGYSAILGTSADRTDIPSNLFEKNTNISNVYGVFDCTAYKTVPGNLFDPFANTLTRAEYAFSRMGNLTSVGADLFKNKPKLTTVSRAFASDGNLTNYIDTDPNIFVGSGSITDTTAMFSGCYKLKTGASGLGEMLYPLTKLTHCPYMFFDCNVINCAIPNGFLSKNTKLKVIDGLFQRCYALPTLPRSLFRVNIGDTNTFPDLVDAKCVFGKCTSMTGVVDSTFFLGAENITNISYDVSYNYPWSVSQYPWEGFFRDTKITGYYETFLNPLTKLRRCSELFRGCTSLEHCYYYEGNEVKERNNTVSENLFANNPLLERTTSMFTDCTKLLGHVPPNLFTPCKSNITQVSYMFNNCTGLTGINLDAAEGDNPATGISNKWFKDCIRLTIAPGFLYNCTNYSGSIPEDLIKDCPAIQETQEMFYNCQNISGGIPLKLFDNCRSSIRNTSKMFHNCIGLTEPLPTGTYTTRQGITGYQLCASSDEGALQVVEKMLDPYTQVSYADVVNLSPNLATIINFSGSYYVKTVIDNIIEAKQLGLLSECTELRNVSGMFRQCKKITGGIPHDLFFTSDINTTYDYLTDVSSLFKDCQSMKQGYIEEETGVKYICNPTFFSKCPAITTFDSTFNRMYALTGCQIHPTMFDKQNKVTTVYEMFMGTPVTGSISPMLFRNCISTLTDARKMFARTSITGVTNGFLNNGAVNTKLKYIYGIFYNCTGITGTSPTFWDGSKFSAIEGSTQGFWGALAGCTKLTNYAEAQSVSSNWINDQEIWL